MSNYVSVLDLFSVGIGPSSSHTVGPMRAAAWFGRMLAEAGELDGPGAARSVRVDLYGSLASTGFGHGTVDAVVVGLEGAEPETVDPAAVPGRYAALAAAPDVVVHGHPLRLGADGVRLHPLTVLPQHPNTLTITAWDAAGAVVREETFCSVGGGFVERAAPAAPARAVPDAAACPPDEPAGGAVPGSGDRPAVPHTFTDSARLLEDAHGVGRDLAELVGENEVALHGEATLEAGLATIWRTMAGCLDAGLRAEGTLPGGLRVRRRAAGIARNLRTRLGATPSTEWLHAYAMAVNEENAAGGRVVTAPTNGAAGIVPAVLRYALDVRHGLAPGEPVPADLPPDGRAAVDADVRTFLLTATAVGNLLVRNASVSGAELGCQAEVGSASAMAAAGLCAVLGGTPEQVENAAEIGIEHNLGLTCDPVGGLVQVPCIERNAVGAVTAVSAARLALTGDGRHTVSLDVVIETMRQTGLDMSSRYKETATGGLAVNVTIC